MSENVPVRIGECQCPDTPHADGDYVYLRPKLGLAAGIAIQRLVVEANQEPKGMDAAAMTGVLAEAYLLHGVESWTMAEPVNPATVKALLLDDFERGAPAADVADDLYMAAVLAPLLKKALTSSPSTSSNGSTSAPGNGRPKHPKQSRRSSTTTTPTVVTAATS